MALVNRGGAEGIVNWLMRNAVSLAREQAQEIAQEIIADAAGAGGQALETIRATIRQHVEDGTLRLSDRGREAMNTLAEGIRGEIEAVVGARQGEVRGRVGGQHFDGEQ